LAHSKILRNPEFEIVRGQGFAAPPPGHQSQSHQVLQELLQQQHQDPPSPQHAVLHSSRPKKPIRIISEFDKPGSFQPMKFSYQKENYEPTTEKSFVSGPPLGDDFFEKYMEKIKRSQQQKKKQKLSFAGLLPSDLVDRGKGNPKILQLQFLLSTRSRLQLFWKTHRLLLVISTLIQTENGSQWT